METKHCPHCGEILPITSTFCPACFKELSTATATATTITVSKKRPTLFLWLGMGAIVVLFFFFMIIFLNGLKSNETPATSAPSLLPEHSATVDSTSPKHTPDSKAPSVTNTTTQFAESILFTATTIGTPATSTPNVTTNGNIATPTISTPTKAVIATILQTPTATDAPPSTTLARTPTHTKVPTNTPRNTVTTTMRPTATQTVPPTQPATDASQFSYTVSDGKATITDYNGSDAIVYVPNVINGYAVKKIDSYAFSYALSLKEVYIPNGITEIQTGAFDNCFYLEKLYIADTVTTLGEGFCDSCYNLNTVKLPERLTKIPDNAFSLCGNLKSIQIPDTVEFIGSGAFSSTGIEQINIPASVTQMESAFYNMNALKYIDVADANPVYCDENGILFRKSGKNPYHTLLVYPVLKTNSNYTLPPSTVYIATDAFRDNGFLQTVTLSEELVAIEPFAFYNCTSLTTVKTYGKLQTIYIGFQYCKNLTSINLEASVTSIDENVFYGCDKLILTVEKDSYAHIFAKENNVPYQFK